MPSQSEVSHARTLTSVQKVRDKTIDGRQVYYARDRINVCANLVIVMVIIALLIIPIYLLYSLAKASREADEQSLDQDRTAISMGILLVFTLVFSAILSLFTRAKRHEILGAAAAYVLVDVRRLARMLTFADWSRYCAVLVVFLGNVNGD